MRWLVVTLEWLVLLPLWRRIFKPKIVQWTAAAVTALIWVIVIAVAAAAGGGGDNGESASAQATSPPSAGVTNTRAAESEEATEPPEPTDTQVPPTVTPAPIAVTGQGQQASQVFQLTDGLAIFRMAHDGGSNFAIWLLDGNGEQIELLVNEIGSFDGAKAVGVAAPGDYLLDVTADGSWAVTIEQPRGVVGQAPPPQITGRGQQVSQVLALTEGLARIQMTHDGQSNFAIWLLDENGSPVDLLVNEIGSFDGSTALQIPGDGNYILDVAADGNWTIAIAQ